MGRVVGISLEEISIVVESATNGWRTLVPAIVAWWVIGSGHSASVLVAPVFIISAHWSLHGPFIRARWRCVLLLLVSGSIPRCASARTISQDTVHIRRNNKGSYRLLFLFGLVTIIVGTDGLLLLLLLRL